MIVTWLSSRREYSGNTAREESERTRKARVGGFSKKKKRNFNVLDSCLCHPNTSSPKYPNQDPTNPAILCHPAREYAVTSFVMRGNT
jgi:hypothetical protein